MCGICGFVGSGIERDLTRMVATLHHRGPDEAGLWMGEAVALGMRRLSIIDVATGHQPVFNETGRIAVVFNGEIYNHVELRERLRAQGHRFQTDHSDTEVIVHLYEEKGLDFLDDLNGMFAIALWDMDSSRLVLARDRAGIKPLYFAQGGDGGLVFGSEPKALLAHPAVSREPDLLALHHYLSLKNVPAPFSAFKAIRQLRAGERLVWEGGEIRVDTWWRPVFAEDASLGEAEAAARIRALLEDSVRLQMRSDVPVGAYLSGGIDSSSVVALMAKLGAANVKTFTLVYEDGFANKDADRRFARQVSERYGTDHHEHVVTYADVPQYLDDIVTAFDEPFSGVVSTFFITQCIARHVKVALSGDGADELFGSYAPHRLAQPLAAAQAMGDLAHLDESQLALLTGHDPKTLAGILARGDEAARRMAQYIADDAAKEPFYTARMREAVAGRRTEDLVRDLYAAAGTSDPLNRALFVDFQSLLPDQVLPFVDRLSMAHSVEVRPPFLDHRMIELAATIPGAMKIKAGRVKHILKEAVRDLLPQDLLDRPKEGFIMPINEWILARLRPEVEALLSPASLAAHGLIAPEPVQAMLAAHYAGTANHGNRIWNLMMLQSWWKKYQS